MGKPPGSGIGVGVGLGVGIGIGLTPIICIHLVTESVAAKGQET